MLNKTLCYKGQGHYSLHMREATRLYTVCLSRKVPEANPNNMLPKISDNVINDSVKFSLSVLYSGNEWNYRI